MELELMVVVFMSCSFLLVQMGTPHSMHECENKRVAKIRST